MNNPWTEDNISSILNDQSDGRQEVEYAKLYLEKRVWFLFCSASAGSGRRRSE